MASSISSTIKSKRKAGRTPPIPGGGPDTGSGVAEANYFELGGIDQWGLMRGADSRRNPILIMLHGGPGISETVFCWRYHNAAALEQVFTVVYWDQRGSGNSYYYDGEQQDAVPKESMTVEQFLADLDELVDLVRQRFHKQKVVLFGHSWGSVLGPLYAARFPHKVQMYIGCGQLGDWAASERETYQFALDEAERLHNQRAIKELRQVGPPPHDCDGLCTQRKWLAEFEGDTTVWQAVKMMYMHIRVPEASIMDLFCFWKVLRFSIDAMWSEVTAINLIEVVPELEMPTFFLLGRRDHCVSSSKVSMEYIESLITTAPFKKEVIWFEESKHMPFMDEPDKFNSIMTNVVRPTLDEETSKG